MTDDELANGIWFIVT